jgi:TRAP-type C4-dicarboxylate transport system permease small subunit
LLIVFHFSISHTLTLSSYLTQILPKTYKCIAAAIIGLLCLLLVLFSTVIWLGVIYCQRRRGGSADEDPLSTVDMDDLPATGVMNLHPPHQ